MDNLERFKTLLTTERYKISKIRLCVPQAKEKFILTYSYFLQQQEKKFIFSKEYEEIISYLEDNKGKSLLMFGNIGRGKSLIGNYIIPVLYSSIGRNIHCYSWRNLTTVDVIKEIQKYAICYIDDIGRENNINDYGNIHRPIEEIIDAAYESKRILILSTNLTGEQFKQKYDIRTLDRIKEQFKIVMFKGESFR